MMELDLSLWLESATGIYSGARYTNPDLICAAECVKAFELGDKQNAERLLDEMPQQPSRIYVPLSHKNTVNKTLLHMAAHNGWVDVTNDLVTNHKCNVNQRNFNGRTPLHYAAANGQLEVVRYFINEQHCDPMTRDNTNHTPLHVACHHLNVIQYLVGELSCDPSCVTFGGNTPLHLACLSQSVRVVEYLLSTVNAYANALAKNAHGKTPVDLASIAPNFNYDLLKLFHSLIQCKKDFPVHTYTKLLLIGNSGAGKTTISQLILLLTSKPSFFSLGHVTDTECHTAGIIPLHVESKINEVNNMVIYDFAGQQEYYSSHAAVLERIMKNSAAVFACIIDLSQCKENISESMHYWISFIENTSSSTQGSHVIIVGSHADRIKSSQELKQKRLLVESIAESRVKQLVYGGFVSMDCRLSKTKEARHFRSLLSFSQKAMLLSQPSMSLYCHVLYAFLRTKLKKTGCTLQELTSALASEKDFPVNSTVLTESLISLSDRGLILFVQNHQSSWVVVEKETLLREVNGTLFAPDNFKQYCQVASNTGIVPIATLEKLFPQHSSEILVGCLDSMEFCHPVDPSALQGTNLEPIDKTILSSDPLSHVSLFFPSLIKECQPDDLQSPRFGWCLGCSNPHQFFSSRFLHVLLLRLAFTFPLTSDYLPLSSPLCGLERRCQVWRNGISWKSVSGVSTIVEIVDRNRWVIVLVSEKSREAAEISSSIIRMILDLQQQLCSIVSTCECLISPSLLDRYPFDALPNTDLFVMRDVARSMLFHHKLILDRKKGKNEFSTDKALSCEPYYHLQPSSVCQLFKQSMANQPVPDTLLQEVLGYCQQPQDHKELRECLSKYSIFAARNPLVSCVHIL